MQLVSQTTTYGLALVAGLSLSSSLCAQSAVGEVVGETKISSLTGGFGGSVQENDWFGAALDVIGDVDGDGVDDMAVGTRNANDGAPDAGGVWILFLNADGTVKAEQEISATEGGLGPVLLERDFFGEDVAGVGDLDGDGVPDLAVAASGDDGTCTGSVFCAPGAVYILFLNADGTVKSHVKHSAEAAPFHTTDDVRLGEGLAFLGDLSGDGFPELAIGAPRFTANGGPLQSGALFICTLAPTGAILATEQILDTPPINLAPADGFGNAIAAIGDIDDDGVTDLAVGVPGKPGPFDEGGVFIVRMNADGTPKGFALISDGVGGFSDPLELADWLGTDVAGVGDLNGDGVPDIAASMMRDDEGGTSGQLSDTGTVYVLFLDTTGNMIGQQRINLLEGNLGAPLVDRDFFGSGLASFGDLEGDGCVRLAVGAIGDDDADSDFGAIYMLDLRPVPMLPLEAGALAGTLGAPSLTGTGALTDGSPLSVTLSDALPGSAAWLVLGFDPLYATFKGGTMVPSVDVILGGAGIPTGAGGFTLPTTWPSGIPAGVKILMQFWVQDPGGPVGFAASNALVATAAGL